MKKIKGQRFTAWLMALMIGLGVVFPANVALAATPASLDADVTVSGVAENGTIDGSIPVEIEVTFPVPVKGDDGSDYFEHNDEITLPLSTSFAFDPGSSFPLMDGTKTLGTVTLRNNVSGQAEAHIVFNGDEDIFDPDLAIENVGSPYSDVSGSFKASFEYNGTHETDGDGNKTVAILNKTYQLQLPGDIITYTVAKEGAITHGEDTITWTVTVTAEKDTDPDPTPIDLADYVFEDDLSAVGEYVGGSFSLSGGTVVDANLAVPDETSSMLTYTFPEGSTSPQTLTFKTKISDAMLTNGGNISNGAGLYLDGTELDFDYFTVTITKPSATKTGVATDGFSGTSYNPADRTITWYVEVDNEGRTLTSLTITDELKGGLTFDSAQWQRKTGINTWEGVDGKSWSTAPTDNKYVIGDVDYVGRLVIVTIVPNDVDTVAGKTYYNQATASWTGAGGASGSAATGNPGVGIGYDAITKSGEQIGDDAANHKITWTINVDMKGQTATDFKVYDLFVHDADTPNADLTGAANWPSGLALSGITRNNGQRYAGVDSDGTDDHLILKVNPINLVKEGKHIATLVEITGLRESGSNKVVFKSQVFDPDIIAGNNSSQKVNNTAALYKGTTFRGEDDASVSYNNKVLAKEMLNRIEVGNDYDTEASINPNNRTTSAANGFHYGYKEVIFRLNVNAANVDFEDVETNLAGGFGDVIITDTLPEGWEFAKFSGGQDYLIYNTTGAINTGSGYPATGSLTAGAALLSVDGLTAVFSETDPQTATFTFENLNQPYVILVKARPADATFDDYLTGDNTHNKTNTLSLRSENWTPGKSVSQQVRVNSTILNKTLNSINQNEGILTWTVNYTPFGREIGTGLEDTLPQGIDLRTDSSGQLIWEQGGSRNINVHELTLKADGSGDYDQGAEFTPEQVKAAVSYDNDTRKLTFTFPETTKAYRLTYVTDITGTPGAVTNAVKLVDATGTGTGTDQGFTITAQQGLATMSRSGYLIVKKTDMGSDPLPGAEFTLYNTNADGSKGSARAVRTTTANGIVSFYGLAPGNYILVETKAPLGGYENPSLEYTVVVAPAPGLTTTVNGSGTITSTNPYILTNYKSTDPVGSLTIRKTVAGNAADSIKTFDFTVTLDGATGSYTYVGQGVPGGTIESGDTISLAHGQSITVTGLPTGTPYTVIEANYSGDGYRTVSTGATGSIETNITQTAAFTNTRNVWPSDPDNRTGTMTISKTVTGTGADTMKKFQFTVTFTGASGSYQYTGNGVPNGTIKSGDAISLANGQSITITGLPAGSEYQVSEDKAAAQGYSVESTGDSGTISSSQDRTAAFTNTKLPDTTGSLTISKTVTGQGADLSKKFDFTITFTDAPDAYPYTGTSAGTLRSGDTVSLSNGESITITGLPKGAAYTVTEANYAGDGYTATSTGAAGIIAAGTAQTASFTNRWGNAPDKPGTPGDPSENIGDGDTPQGSMDGGESGMPKTGDSQAASHAKLGLLFFSVALATLITADFVLRRKYSGKRIRK